MFQLGSIYAEKLPPPPRHFYVVGYDVANGEVELIDRTFITKNQAQGYIKANKAGYTKLYIFKQSLGELVE